MDIEALERRARELLDPAVYDYYAGGAGLERTVAENRAAWGRLLLRPRVLRDVGTVRTGTTVLGTDSRLPILIAPMAYQRLAHDDGEIAMARAAAEAGIVMVVSTLATTSLEDVATGAPRAPRWFQLYVHRDRGLTKDLLGRAAAAGYEAIVLTVDLPVLGHRPRDDRHRFTLPPHLQMANFGVGSPLADGSALAAYADTSLDPTLTFEDLAWIRQASGLPLVVKGVLRADDAVASVDAGASAVIVSNHGGRQIDTVVSGAQALPEVVAAIGDRAEVYVDGGVRDGTDVVKALALGARAVLVGRPFLWALATAGQRGVTELLEALRADLVRTMALCGLRAPEEVEPDLVTGG